jgi:hypothetical protein
MRRGCKHHPRFVCEDCKKILRKAVALYEFVEVEMSSASPAAIKAAREKLEKSFNARR